MAIEGQRLQLDIAAALGFVLLLGACGSSKRAITRSTTYHPTFAPRVAPLPKYSPLFSDGAEEKVERESYIEKYKALAMREMKRCEIPASITLAQGLWESNSGLSFLAEQANNHFGIKCHNWSGPGVKHDDDAPGECFRKYDSVNQSFIDHSRFLRERRRYRGLFKLRIDDYRGWAYELQADGYATDKSYAEHLISLIEQYDLQRFDQLVLKGESRGKKRVLGLHARVRRGKAIPITADRIEEAF